MNNNKFLILNFCGECSQERKWKGHNNIYKKYKIFDFEQLVVA